MATACAYCEKVEPLPYQCALCSKHFCSAHREPRSHECAMYSDSSEKDSLSEVRQESIAAQAGLPYSILAHKDPHFFAGNLSHAVIAMDLKKAGWTLRLQKGEGNVKDILADKDQERWYIRVKTSDARLVDALHDIPMTEEEMKDLEAKSRQENAQPVIAIVASDSAAMVSAKTFMALNP